MHLATSAGRGPNRAVSSARWTAFTPFPMFPRAPGRGPSGCIFNGRSPDGRLRVYVTFLVGPRADTPGKRHATVRVQIERDGRSSNYSAHEEVDEALVLANAPDLEMAGNRVRLEGRMYRMTLAVDSDRDASETQLLAPGSVAQAFRPAAARPKPRATVTGEIVLEAAPNQSLPPSAIRGAGGWVSGYVVPVLAGTMRGTLRIGGESLVFENAAGYHDHNSNT